MITLSSRPTFGYEYATCNANERRIKDMKSKLTLQKSDTELEQTARVSYIVSNIFKLLGAFVPLVGAGRIILAVLQNDEQMSQEVIRGLAELFGAGMLMIGIDIAATLFREYEARKFVMI